jgi:cytochrome c oxidase subunit I
VNEAILTDDVAADAARPRGPGAWLTTTDHKWIGVLYVATGLAFFLVGVGFAMLMKTQLIRPGMHLLTPEEYSQVFSMHGTTMVFLFAMPMLIGVANYVVPLQIGARDMAFPRMNALSYWLFLFGGLLLYSSFAFGGALDTGWFSYAPLSLPAYSPHDGVTFWTVSLALLGASSIMGAVNFIVTMLRFRARGMGLWQMPIFSVATFLNSFLIVFAFPSLTAAIAMLYLDRHYGTGFFNPAMGGQPIIWQHLFWFFGHPEVYILILPAFGIMSEVVPVFSRKQLFGRNTMIVMLGVILILSFLVWGHHMFTTGLPTLFNTIIAGTTMLIAIPTGVKIFNWLATMWGGSLRFKPPLLFACGLIALFTVGGITGVIQGAVPFDWQANATYFIVGHLHNVLIAGTVFAVFAGIYYWYPKATGRLLNARLGTVQFWLTIVGFSLTFLPMYALGLMGMPRRVYTYAPDLGWNTLNLVSSIGGYILATSFVIFIYNLVRSARSGEPAGDNPWRAWSLEWATSSPPPAGNFRALPPITSERPLWDLEQAGQPTTVAAAVAAADAAAPSAETAAAVWRPLASEPGQSTVTPFFVALSVLVVAVGLLSTPVVIAIGVGLLIVTLAVWMGGRWVEPEIETLPGQRFSFMGVGMLVFIGSESVFFAALIAAAIHLRIHLPQSGAGTHLATAFPAFNTTVLVLSGVAAHYAQVSYRRQRRERFFLLLVLTIILGAAFLGGQAWEYSHLGFGLTASLAASTFFTLTGFHGLHVACGIGTLVYLLVRAARERRRGTGESSPGTSGMVDAATYYWHFVDAVWVVVFIVVYLL